MTIRCVVLVLTSPVYPNAALKVAWETAGRLRFIHSSSPRCQAAPALQVGLNCLLFPKLELPSVRKEAFSTMALPR